MRGQLKELMPGTLQDPPTRRGIEVSSVSHNQAFTRDYNPSLLAVT